MGMSASDGDDIFCFDDPEQYWEELHTVVSEVLNGSGMEIFLRAHQDIGSLFEGKYSGYRACNTPYHDFSHTVSVVSASARILHGCLAGGIFFPPSHRLLTLLAALFHDVGLIQSEKDLNGTGAKHTLGHEQRSIRFARIYLPGLEFGPEETEQCANLIRCTDLEVTPSEIPFLSETWRTCGCILGSADLLAQMADRLYLEKLLFLHEEFKEARIPGIGTVIDFLKRSEHFHETIAEQRLEVGLGNIRRYLKTHFRVWRGIDLDLYAEAIDRNHRHLKEVIGRRFASTTSMARHLRRGGILASYSKGGK